MLPGKKTKTIDFSKLFFAKISSILFFFFQCGFFRPKFKTLYFFESILSYFHFASVQLVVQLCHHCIKQVYYELI